MPPVDGGRPPVIVLSLGGSLFSIGRGDARYLVQLVELLRAVGQDSRLAVVVGGGATARRYIDLGRSLGLNEIELDELGIDVTRLHARLLACLLGPPTPADPPSTVAEAVRELHRASPIVLGGTEPGHTTDGVGALIAERARAVRFVNATKVGGLFDRDPHRYPNAERIPRITWAEFSRRFAGRAGTEAGQHFVMDRLGAERLARSAIPTAIVDGRNLAALREALRGRSFRGTLIE